LELLKKNTNNTDRQLFKEKNEIMIENQRLKDENSKLFIEKKINKNILIPKIRKLPALAHVIIF
jgi:cell division protein FtsL